MSFWAPQSGPVTKSVRLAIAIEVACFVIAGLILALVVHSDWGWPLVFGGLWSLTVSAVFPRLGRFMSRMAGKAPAFVSVGALTLGALAVVTTAGWIVGLGWLNGGEGGALGTFCAVLVLISVPFLLVGLVLGIVGLRKYKSRRAFSAWGTGLSAFALLLWASVATVGILLA